MLISRICVICDARRSNYNVRFTLKSNRSKTVKYKWGETCATEQEAISTIPELISTWSCDTSQLIGIYGADKQEIRISSITTTASTSHSANTAQKRSFHRFKRLTVWDKLTLGNWVNDPLLRDVASFEELLEKCTRRNIRVLNRR